jgi:hypothetical protein
VHPAEHLCRRDTLWNGWHVNVKGKPFHVFLFTFCFIPHQLTLEDLTKVAQGVADEQAMPNEMKNPEGLHQ